MAMFEATKRVAGAVVAVMTACAGAAPSPPPTSDGAPNARAAAQPAVAGTPSMRPRARLLSMEVGPCFGVCPVYSIALYDDGLLVFTGRTHVAVVGERRAQLAAETVSSIIRTFDEARFFELDDFGRLPVPPRVSTSGSTSRYDFRDDVVCADTSHTEISYEHGGRQRTLDEAHCEETALSRLEARVFSLLAVEAWIGG